MLDKELWQKYRIKKLSLKEKSIVIVITWMNSSEFFFYVVILINVKRILQVCSKDKGRMEE